MRDARLLRQPLAWIALALAAWLALALGLVYISLDALGRAQFAHWLASRAVLLAAAWMFAAVLAMLALRRWWLPRVVALPELAEQTRAIVAASQPLQIQARGQAGQQPLADAINALAAQRDALRGDVTAEVMRANASLRLERNRLAALMAELTQSVVVCNRDGRILLYNSRARLQFRALSDAPQLADGAELIGIGRSIYAVFDQQLVAHALDSIQQRLARGAAQPSAQFVTGTRGGQLLRVQVAPVTEPGDGATALDGFVLMLDNITRSFEEESARVRLLHGLTEGSRASLASLRAAVEMLGYDDLEPAMRERFLAVLRDETATMVQRVDAVARQSADSLRTRWPLEEMQGAEFVDVAVRQLGTQCRVPVAADAVDAALWLKLDSFSMLQALAHLGQRLVDEFGVRALMLRLATHGTRAQLDLVWTGHAMSTETVMGWEMEPMQSGGETLPLSVRDVIERHDAEMWFERDRASHQAFFRFLLPLASSAEKAHERADPVGSRPEFFDFDLFDAAGADTALDERRLCDLVYTVFDTETTGLNPSGGDEIIQIGAARIVNGKLLRQESFEQLVDPGRAIPAAGIAIHGITADMVAGQPRIDEVLPAFHQFAQDTVLVAHNAAFDMKFLQAPARRAGLRFQQPVLDTLLLSALVHPHQASHRLEAIAERFGIAVLGRHTALGDALVTAEVLLQLIPLLAEKGIVTLAQAREAARETYYARLKY
ncbi:exonuclease domain-containing protein [Ottowia sp. SB7-C50]|uniref:3'-5' exonuclease n=1 Tax=Ottowia sp. SB7-C50 TaxID=3081231 RepID=UPI002954C627|nr:exonuclease domain-containing protein [Ottowia sp. SB7-C50]WOP15130.1 exonuclease domain-containing protein [Ottowia sp. SB7-C50]